MLVKLTEGIRAGETVDMPAHVALTLIAQNRVIDLRRDEPESDPTTQERKPQKKGR